MMNEGRIVGEFPAAGTTQEMIMGAIIRSSK
jgi:putative multiple sugar transport system ATP-binding protein